MLNSVTFQLTSLSSKFRFSWPWSMWWSEIRKKNPKFFGPDLKIPFSFYFLFCFVCVFTFFFLCKCYLHSFFLFRKTEILYRILYPILRVAVICQIHRVTLHRIIMPIIPTISIIFIILTIYYISALGAYSIPRGAVGYKRFRILKIRWW